MSKCLKLITSSQTSFFLFTFYAMAKIVQGEQIYRAINAKNSFVFLRSFSRLLQVTL